MRAGEARNVVNTVLEEHGADRMRQTIDSALNLAGIAHSTVSAVKASRRSWWLAVLATLVSILVAVPPLRQLLDEVKSSSSNDSDDGVPHIAKWVVSLGFLGPWVLIFLIIALVLALICVGWIVRHRPSRIPGIRRGFAWPRQFTVSRSAQGDDKELDAEGARQ